MELVEFGGTPKIYFIEDVKYSQMVTDFHISCQSIVDMNWGVLLKVYLISTVGFHVHAF